MSTNDDLPPLPEPAWVPSMPNMPYSHGQMQAYARAAVAADKAKREPDMRHPRIQHLISSKARAEIRLQLVEKLIDEPDCDLTCMDMEYWDSLHDKLKEALMAKRGPGFLYVQGVTPE